MSLISVAVLSSLPSHVPNRGEDGLAKRATLGGVDRTRISYQCQQFALRQSPEFPGIESAAGIGHSYRTAQVSERVLIPALTDAGAMDPEAWATALTALWGSNGAPAIVGEQEVRLMVAVAVAAAAEGLSPANLADKKLPAPVTAAIKALRLASGAVGLDGALFGRMTTGSLVSNVDRSFRIADALSTGAASVEADFFLTSDDLKDRDSGEFGGSHIGTRELASGVFIRQGFFDLDQMARNGIDPVLVVPELTSLFITMSPVGGRAAASVIDAVVEIGGSARSVADAFARPVSAPDAAVSALRAYLTGYYEMVGAPEKTLWLSEQAPVKLRSLEAEIRSAIAATPALRAVA